MKRFEKLHTEEELNFFEKNKNTIYGFIGGAIVGIIFMFILWPNRIAKLKNGEEPVVSLNGYSITADDLYKKLKEKNSLTSLLYLVDNYVLREKYDLNEAAKEYAKEESSKIYKQYEVYYGYSKEEFLETNYDGEEKLFLEELELEYLYQYYTDEYAKSLIDDKMVEDYYKNSVFGEKKLYIISSVDDKTTIDKVRSLMKNGTTISTIKKKYSNLSIEELTVSYEDMLLYTEDTWTQIKNTKEKSYSNVFEDSISGYTFVYVTSEDEKVDFDENKDNIINVMVAEMEYTDNSLFVKAFIKLREEYGIKFNDTEMKKKYDEYIMAYK